MRWALLGVETEQELGFGTAAGGPRPEWVRVSASEWESLLARADIDVVVVGRQGTPAEREEQLRKLVAAGIKTIVRHPAIDTLAAYELEWIREEAHGILIPWVPGWLHPSWDRLQVWAANPTDSPLGEWHEVSFERPLADRTESAVRDQLAQDVEWFRRLLGEMASVHAVGMERPDGSWQSLAVQYRSLRGVAAVWNLAAAEPAAEIAPGAVLRIVGTAGTATLTLPHSTGAGDWVLRVVPRSGGSGEETRFPPANELKELMDRLGPDAKATPSWTSWSAACLDLEWVDGAEKSWRKKRAIDLEQISRGEEKTFKGLMAAAGCLAMLLVLAGFLAFAVWDGIAAPFRPPPGTVDQPREVWPLWARLWPVYPLVVLLLMQLLLPIARRGSAPPADHHG